MERKKPIILSGIQPSGQLCIANYIGAIKNWVDFQDDYDSIFLIVDMHALTVKQVPAELRKRCLSFLAQYIACGIDPQKSTIAIQSHIPQHAELTWVLNCITSLGELNRMTQFKDKSKKNESNINAGLFTYPILMAADILLYQADLVPVGADQKQHLELTRNLAQRFNHLYSDTFVVPEPYIPKFGARIMSLQDPTSKMSKSDKNENSLVALLDHPDVITKKIKRAVTDSGTEIRFDDKNPGISNLISLYSVLTKKSVSEVESHFEGKMYSALKIELAEVIVDTLKPIQQRYNEIMKDKNYLEGVLEAGAENAYYRARKTLSKVYRKIGFIAKK
ncbi:MAG: tryptophan--tRNA ligase [Candidatus Marinimicrobia bacterium]|nr:tryptophan--tRNA ligase [Candidatus Neomarinimicrobiota bacterium]MBL7022627.1 tryptophan--tRNA ligase [Candidatus Neomarinimicrobiota bacterium]MBL7109630.1 tryptophan--tRNA ligase [Candidatus Neomarinimicrobiota bacterium]